MSPTANLFYSHKGDKFLTGFLLGINFIKVLFKASAVGASLNFPLGNESAIFFKMVLSAPLPKETEWNSILSMIDLSLTNLFIPD